MALEKRASMDVAVVARLRKRRDEQIQTAERLCSKHGMAHEECDQAFREHDQAYQKCDNGQQKISSLQAELERETTRKLEAESISNRLAMDLAEVRRNL